MRLRCLAYNIGGGCADNLEALYAILAHTQPDVAALTEANDSRVVQAGLNAVKTNFAKFFADA